MTEKSLRELDAWIWKTIFKGYTISKRFSLKRTGFKLRDESGEWPNNGGCHGWGWQSSRESALLHIPRYTTDPAAAMAVLLKCYEFDRNSCLASLHNFLMRKEHDASLTPLQICLFAKQLFSKP